MSKIKVFTNKPLDLGEWSFHSRKDSGTPKSQGRGKALKYVVEVEASQLPVFFQQVELAGLIEAIDVKLA
jgi:hypothetical protein